MAGKANTEEVWQEIFSFFNDFPTHNPGSHRYMVYRETLFAALMVFPAVAATQMLEAFDKFYYASHSRFSSLVNRITKGENALADLFQYFILKKREGSTTWDKKFSDFRGIVAFLRTSPDPQACVDFFRTRSGLQFAGFWTSAYLNLRKRLAQVLCNASVSAADLLPAFNRVCRAFPDIEAVREYTENTKTKDTSVACRCF